MTNDFVGFSQRMDSEDRCGGLHDAVSNVRADASVAPAGCHSRGEAWTWRRRYPLTPRSQYNFKEQQQV
jgi:hypothetical protein